MEDFYNLLSHNGVYPNSLAKRNTSSQAIVPPPTMQLMLTLYPRLQYPSNCPAKVQRWEALYPILQCPSNYPALGTLYPRIQCPHNRLAKGDILLQTTVSSPTAQIMGTLSHLALLQTLFEWNIKNVKKKKKEKKNIACPYNLLIFCFFIIILAN